MNEEEFFNRMINRICKDYGYEVANSFKLMYLKKDKQLEAYENMRKEAIEYVKEFTFESLLVNEDRKLIMYNENLKNFENILNKVGENNE